MEFHSTLKRKEIPTLAATQTKLEDIMRGKINQIQRDKSSMIPGTRGPYNSQLHRDGK